MKQHNINTFKAYAATALRGCAGVRDHARDATHRPLGATECVNAANKQGLNTTEQSVIISFMRGINNVEKQACVYSPHKQVVFRCLKLLEQSVIISFMRGINKVEKKACVYSAHKRSNFTLFQISLSSPLTGGVFTYGF